MRRAGHAVPLAGPEGAALRENPVDVRIVDFFFHYVNVGPNLQEDELITDVYLPLR